MTTVWRNLKQTKDEVLIPQFVWCFEFQVDKGQILGHVGGRNCAPKLSYVLLRLNDVRVPTRRVWGSTELSLSGSTRIDRGGGGLRGSSSQPVYRRIIKPGLNGARAIISTPAHRTLPPSPAIFQRRCCKWGEKQTAALARRWLRARQRMKWKNEWVKAGRQKEKSVAKRFCCTGKSFILTR